MQIKKELGRVYFSGQLKPTEANVISGSLSVIAGTVPAGYLPHASDFPVFVCQGSGTDRWTMQISNGNIIVARYSAATHTASAWLPFSVSWDAATP